ncbi:hypothetical protein LAX5112_01321 [Roseibium alexandrii]|uniref:Uncharacterized protein n=1 Tax=Roseibium alexandrii TaxID=388408 RepID=A0A0M6ZYB4_9HYPH|nr:hypothetical protein LAX5112_01321 [Roseibium alexandrii]
MAEGIAVALGEGFEDGILVVDEPAIRQHQNRKALVVFAEKLNEVRPRAGPGDAFDIQVCAEIRKGRQHTFH